MVNTFHSPVSHNRSFITLQQWSEEGNNAFLNTQLRHLNPFLLCSSCALLMTVLDKFLGLGYQSIAQTFSSAFMIS